jgi:hypothetical protein
VLLAPLAPLLLLAACSGDDRGPAAGTAAPTTTASVTATTEPPACGDLAEDYLDAFFAVGAGTPEDADATTVTLPAGELRAIVVEARQAGCAEFDVVVCSAYSELEAQALTPNRPAPVDC